MIVDQAQALLGGMQVVPDFAAQQAQREQLELQRMAIQQRQQQAKQAFMEMEREQHRQTAWQERVRLLQSDPRPENIRASLLEFPEMRESITAAFEGMGAADLREIGAVYSLIEAGDNEGAAARIERRIAADTAAGQPPDEEDAAALAALRSGNRNEINRYRAGLGVVIAAHPNGDKFTQNMGRLQGGGAEPTTFQRDYEYMLRNFGPQIAANYRARQTDRIATDADGNIVALPDATPAGPELQRGGGPVSTQRGGGAPAAPAGRTAPQLMQAASASKRITRADYDAIAAELGPNGRAALEGFIRTEGITLEGAPVRVRSVQQAEALAPGTRFIDPDGVERIR
jgi:hypothetical protein